ALLLVVMGWSRLRGAAPALLGFLLALDLAPTSIPSLRHGSAAESALTAYPEPRLAAFGRAEPSARVFSTRLMDVSGWQIAGLNTQPEERTNDWIRWRAHAFGGEHGTPPASYEEFAFTRSSETLRALGVVYVSSTPDAAQDSSTFATEARTPREV